MTCQACGSPLAPGARFCASCGAPVVATCPQCGEILPAGARFCPGCGATIAQADLRAPATASTPRERKVATLLFADLVGFTSIGEAHDPEVVGALVSEVFERVQAEVVRYEGTVEKFAGDAMLAVFGVPIVHEDDAERAVRAALEMQAAMGELGVEFRARGREAPVLRIGVESGEVLVDVARAGAERDLFVTGDAVNTAARLQQSAAPGTVVVGPATYLVTRELVEYEELPAAMLKGKRLAVAAWRAVAVKARRAGRRAPLGIEAPIIGRDEEISLLKETVRRSVADGRPHVITVVGAAGVGKSRLSWELEKYLDGLPETYHWRKGRCLAYAQSSYSALADVIKADARIMDDDAPSMAEEKLDARVRELHGEAPDAIIGAALRAVLALGPISSQPKDVLFEAWRRHLDAVARLAPLVLVLEDIHWADTGLLDFIEFFARWSEGPVTILCLARHELLERRPSWGGGTLNANTIVLEPLERSEGSRLVDALLGTAVPAALRDKIVDLADGNPLFAEELVRMFVDRGVLRFTDGRWELTQPVDEVEVPSSVQAVLAARLDGLPGAEKQLAQNAAVVGRIFWDAVLAHLSRQGSATTTDLLRRLRVKELVVPREPSSLAGASEFGFRHVLIRDVAYDSLPKRDRASRHLDVARWAEEALAERQEEFVELLAAHYLAALRYEEEFGTDAAHLLRIREQTQGHLRRAADRAYRLGQIETATSWMRLAVDHSRRLGLDPRQFAEVAEQYMLIGFANESGSAAFEVVNEALTAMLALPDPSADDRATIARLRAEAGRSLYLAQRVGEAKAVLEGGLAEEHAPVGRATLISTLGWLYWRLGETQVAVPLLEEALELATKVGAHDIERVAMHDLGVAHAMGGSPAGIPLVARSFELAKEAGDANLIARSLINLPSVKAGNGDDWREILPLLEEGMTRARRGVHRGGIAWIGGNYADVLLSLGRLPEAIAINDEAVAAAVSFGDLDVMGQRQIAQAVLLVLAGDRAAAEALATPEIRAVGGKEIQARTSIVMLDALLAWPDADRTVAALLEIVTGPGAPNGEQAGMFLARIGLRLDRPDLIATGVGFIERSVGRASGPFMRLFLDAARGLGSPTAAGVDRLLATAEALQAAGYLLPAADAFADAAVLAARSGGDGHAVAQRARDLYVAMSIVPPLGDPVETLVEGQPAVG